MLFRIDIMSLNVNVQDKWKDLSDCTIRVYLEIILLLSEPFRIYIIGNYVIVLRARKKKLLIVSCK